MLADAEIFELTARVIAGNLQAFGPIVLEYQKPIRAYLAVRMNDQNDAEDLAQEVFIIAHRKLASYDPTRPFGSWLRGIAFNLLRNYLRRRREFARGSASELEELMEHHVEDMDQEGGFDRVAQALDACVAKLAPHLRELLEKRHVEGLSIAELCEVKKCGHSAMTMTFHRMRRTLRECVEKNIAEMESVSA